MISGKFVLAMPIPKLDIKSSQINSYLWYYTVITIILSHRPPPFSFLSYPLFSCWLLPPTPLLLKFCSFLFGLSPTSPTSHNSASELVSSCISERPPLSHDEPQSIIIFLCAVLVHLIITFKVELRQIFFLTFSYALPISPRVSSFDLSRCF